MFYRVIFFINFLLGSTWPQNFSKMNSKYSYPVEANIVPIRPKKQDLLKRIKSDDKDFVERIEIFFKNRKSVKSKIKSISLFSKVDEFSSFAMEHMSYDKVKKKHKLVLSSDMLDFISLLKLQDLYAEEHYELYLDFTDNLGMAKKLYKEAKVFLSHDQRVAFIKALKKKQKISLEDALLPSFSRKSSRRYSIYKGPNCFHSSMAFQGLGYSNSNSFNSKIEQGHHRIMINNDELYRLLLSQFYEVDTSKSPLVYGDVIIFLEVPRDLKALDLDNKYHYTWIKHATVFLLNRYTFSKGSKSANSAYTIKTLDKELKKWEGILNNLYIKVYRKSQKTRSIEVIRNRHEWLY